MRSQPALGELGEIRQDILGERDEWLRTEPEKQGKRADRAKGLRTLGRLTVAAAGGWNGRDRWGLVAGHHATTLKRGWRVD